MTAVRSYSSINTSVKRNKIIFCKKPRRKAKTFLLFVTIWGTIPWHLQESIGCQSITVAYLSTCWIKKKIHLVFILLITNPTNDWLSCHLLLKSKSHICSFITALYSIFHWTPWLSHFTLIGWVFCVISSTLPAGLSTTNEKDSVVVLGL